MKWRQERDLLIAQTMAFAQSVSGKATEAESRLEDARFKDAGFARARLEGPPIDAPATSTPPAPRVPVQPLGRPATLYNGHNNPRHYDLREEIRGRVAAFRAHQELLRRDRDDYYNSVLAKVRSLTERGRKASDESPVER